MHIVIAGGSGFLGTALADALVRKATRSPCFRDRLPASAPPPRVVPDMDTQRRSGRLESAIDGATAVVNLAGESIAAKRWSAAQKQRLRDSRLHATKSLTTAIRQAKQTPGVLISGSAVGYYGDRGDETLTESSAPGSDFLAGVAVEWEAAANDVGAVTRVALIRTGIVLDRRGGALPKMLPPFQMFAGGPLGSGRQYMPWIHKDDWVRLVTWGLTRKVRAADKRDEPIPVTNAEFSKALGRALHRPSVLPAPAFALRLALGEMADALLLSGQRALPVRATDHGFAFRFPTSTRRWPKSWPKILLKSVPPLEGEESMKRQLSIAALAIAVALTSGPGPCRSQEGRTQPGVIRRHARPGGQFFRRQVREGRRRLDGRRVRRPQDDHDRRQHGADRRFAAKKRSTTSMCAARPTR